MNARPTHDWRNLAITLGLALGLGGCVIAGFIAVSAAQVSNRP